MRRAKRDIYKSSRYVSRELRGARNTTERRFVHASARAVENCGDR